MSGTVREWTPGRWWIDACDKRHLDHRVSSSAGMVAIVGNGFNIAHARYDAHLIAAAPALYEALHNALAAGLHEEVAAAARAALSLARNDAAGSGEGGGE